MSNEQTLQDNWNESMTQRKTREARESIERFFSQFATHDATVGATVFGSPEAPRSLQRSEEQAQLHFEPMIMGRAWR